MKRPETLQELRDFFANIPEENWCAKYSRRAGGKHCAMDHIETTFGAMQKILIPILGDFMPMVKANDYSPLGPKAGVLEYIDNLIKQSHEKA